MRLKFCPWGKCTEKSKVLPKLANLLVKNTGIVPINHMGDQIV